MNKEQEKELQMMKEAFSWPLWPLLPVKKRKPDGSWPTLGTMYSPHPGDAVKPIIFKETVDEIVMQSKSRSFIPTVLQEYESIEAIVEDGWIVD